ncbi:hypothetical protein [Streptomyces sp. NPDC003697]
MRLCTSLSLCLAAAAAVIPTAGPARAAAGPTCAGPDDRDFPIATRIHGGPGALTAGGGFGTFLLDLKNTTPRICAAIHPVVVVVDAQHALKPGQPRLEFYDGGRPHPVRFQATDQQELVGPFDAGLPGFTVGPGKTVTVKVRLAITSDAVPNDVTVKAAVVQRHDDDGDWVGQSNDYRFRIEPGTAVEPPPDHNALPVRPPRPLPSPTPQRSAGPGRSAAPDRSAAPGLSAAPDRSAAPARSPAPDGSATSGRSAAPERTDAPVRSATPRPSPGAGRSAGPDRSASAGRSAGPDRSATPGRSAGPDTPPSRSSAPAVPPTPAASTAPTAPGGGLSFADELARTGLGTPLGVLTATALLLAAGGAVVIARRRRR